MLLEKSFPKLLLNSIILILLFFGLITIITSVDGKFMQLEFLGFVFLLILTLFTLFNYHRPRGDFYFYIIFLFYILNLLAIWYINITLYSLISNNQNQLLHHLLKKIPPSNTFPVNILPVNAVTPIMNRVANGLRK